MRATTPLFVASAGLIITTVALEFALPASSGWWVALRVLLPIGVLAALWWSFVVFLRAGQLPSWWPDR
jgi:hypothetical protein